MFDGMLYYDFLVESCDLSMFLTFGPPAHWLRGNIDIAAMPVT